MTEHFPRTHPRKSELLTTTPYLKSPRAETTGIYDIRGGGGKTLNSGA
ncbi:MAG: hypothetical protein CM1200mP30_03620 [Pseudomonadota bacterium]|nr:MAG: hypothetical protein CM1200mP30_03620 [Pseudomonadota bacterium]